MRRGVLTWCTFALCLAIVFGAMGYFTAEVRRMQRRAIVEENARLALWRMDSKLAAILARENSLPVMGYIHSPRHGTVTARFRIEADGDVTGQSPLVDVWRLPKQELDIPPTPVAQLPSKSQPKAQGKTEFDYQQRAQQMTTNAMPIQPYGQELLRGAFTAQFVDSKLILLRGVSSSGQCATDAAVIDWQALQAELLADVRDLLPHATLNIDVDATPYRLTVIPASLVPGALPAGDAPPAAPLVIAWFAVILAAVAAGVLLHLTLRLSHRRAAFVSAVTHEMRTPLTTLRLYTEMLASNRVRDDNARQQYLQTLTTEADRLSHLVDNVLAHARLERGKPPEALQTVSIDDLVARCEQRLRTRAEQAQKTIAFTGDGNATVRAEPSIIEQILLNLIDNACKYGGPGSDITVTLQDNTITVADTGPGVAADVRARLFTPFAKSAHDAANSAPGIGLGLALSRRLARAMGGDLRYEDSARFILTLTQAAHGV